MPFVSKELILCATFVTFGIPNVAYAYLDPGTGSMLLQGIIGGVMAVSGVFALYFARVKNFFLRIGSRNQQEVERPEEQQN
ncbi:MAG: hypothetical protein JXR14_08240 [Paracoccaceae bacterium]